MKWLNKLGIVFLYLISIVIIGGTTIITGEIGFNIFRKPSYYLNQVLTWAAIICVTLGTLFSVIDKFVNHNEDYIDCSKVINDFAKSKENIPSILQRFLEILNFNRACRQLEYDIKKKIYKLEKHVKPKNLYIWNHGTQEEKLKDKYCSKRIQLEEMLKTNVIEHKVKTSKIKYDKVTSSIILGGFYSKYDNDSPNEFITKFGTEKVIFKKLSTLMFSFAIMTFLSSFIFGPAEFNMGALINFITKLFMLLWHTLTTVRTASSYCKEVVLKDIRLRRGWVSEYRKWLSQEAIKQGGTTNDDSRRNGENNTINVETTIDNSNIPSSI